MRNVTTKAKLLNVTQKNDGQKTDFIYINFFVRKSVTKCRVDDHQQNTTAILER